MRPSCFSHNLILLISGKTTVSVPTSLPQLYNMEYRPSSNTNRMTRWYLMIPLPEKNARVKIPMALWAEDIRYLDISSSSSISPYFLLVVWEFQRVQCAICNSYYFFFSTMKMGTRISLLSFNNSSLSKDQSSTKLRQPFRIPAFVPTARSQDSTRGSHLF